jgi:hypothetical protein
MGRERINGSRVWRERLRERRGEEKRREMR